jgi:hypothetical protein
MEEIKFDIIEYLGKIEEFVFIHMSLSLDDEYFDAIFCYKEDLVVLTIQKEMEEKLGSVIEDWSGYSELMMSIISKIVPYKEIVNRLDKFDESKYKVIYPV